MFTSKEDYDVTVNLIRRLFGQNILRSRRAGSLMICERRTGGAARTAASCRIGKGFGGLHHAIGTTRLPWCTRSVGADIWSTGRNQPGSKFNTMWRWRFDHGSHPILTESGRSALRMKATSRCGSHRASSLLVTIVRK